MLCYKVHRVHVDVGTYGYVPKLANGHNHLVTSNISNPATLDTAYMTLVRSYVPQKGSQLLSFQTVNRTFPVVSRTFPVVIRTIPEVIRIS